MHSGFVFILLILAGSANANVYDLGVVGQTYDIAEPSLLESIQSKLQAAQASGELAKLEEARQADFIAYANRPRGIALPRAQAHRIHYHDPSVVLSQDIVDHQGKVLWPEGTTVNPLEYVSLSRQWLFFDGDDPAQVAWAHGYLKRYPHRVLPILTHGAVLELMEAWQIKLYFDQGGRYVKHFGIQALPALISQEETRLRIDEIVPEEDHG